MSLFWSRIMLITMTRAGINNVVLFIFFRSSFGLICVLINFVFLLEYLNESDEVRYFRRISLFSSHFANFCHSYFFQRTSYWNTDFLLTKPDNIDLSYLITLFTRINPVSSSILSGSHNCLFLTENLHNSSKKGGAQYL